MGFIAQGVVSNSSVPVATASKRVIAKNIHIGATCWAEAGAFEATSYATWCECCSHDHRFTMYCWPVMNGERIMKLPGHKHDTDLNTKKNVISDEWGMDYDSPWVRGNKHTVQRGAPQYKRTPLDYVLHPRVWRCGYRRSNDRGARMMSPPSPLVSRIRSSPGTPGLCRTF